MKGKPSYYESSIQSTIICGALAVWQVLLGAGPTAVDPQPWPLRPPPGHLGQRDGSKEAPGVTELGA